MPGFWTFVETARGELESASLEVLGKASELAAVKGVKGCAVVIGTELAEVTRKLSDYPVQRIYQVKHELLRNYDPMTYAQALQQLVARHQPEAILFAATYNGTDLAARLAIRAGAGLMAHVVALEVERDSGMLLGHVPAFGGNIAAVCRCRPGVLQMITVRPGVFEAPVPIPGNKPEIIAFEAEIEEGASKLGLVEARVESRVDITRAERVVVAGMGTGGDLKPVQELAEKMRAQIAVTRPLADMGVAPRDLQIGSTGYSLRSKLAIVVGASGAAHFVSGLRNVGTAIAINTDRNAPIFEFADYCVVGDLFKILPKLASLLEGGEAKA